MQSAKIKSVSDAVFLTDLKILLRKCQLMQHLPNKQPAIVFDIDGTLVQDQTWDSPIKSVIDFCNHCKDIGISTFIVTARGGWPSNVKNTKDSLQALGVCCDALFFRNPDQHNLGNFKTNVRQHIVENIDYNILMSLGDNIWDMGKFGGTGVLMKTNQFTNVITYEIKS